MLTEITHGQYVGRAKIFGNFRKSSFISRIILHGTVDEDKHTHDGVYPTKISGAGEAAGRSKGTAGRDEQISQQTNQVSSPKWDGYWNGDAHKHCCNLKNVRNDEIFNMDEVV